MAKHLGLPQECTAVAIIAGNCATQLAALAQALVRPDLADELSRVTQTARNAAKLARDSLDVLLESLGEKPKRKRNSRRQQ